MTVILPKHPGSLVDLALEDLQKTIDAGIHVAMHTWGDGTRDDLLNCSVCLAGSVMLQTTHPQVDPCNYIDVFDVDEDNTNQLYALDDFRLGHIQKGLDRLGYTLQLPDLFGFGSQFTLHNASICSYFVQPKEFISDMKRLSKLFHKYARPCA